MDILKKIHREITPLTKEDSFLVFDRLKDLFDYPIHFHPEFELNFIDKAKGLRRIVGDSIEEVDDFELVLIGSNLFHGWEQHKCTATNIHEITIQFHEDLFDPKFLSRRIMKPLKDMLARSTHGILFSKEVARQMMPRILKVSKMGGIDYFLELFSILYDLSNSRNQRLLSTTTIHLDNFEYNEKLKTLYNYVQDNYALKLTLQEVSEIMNMSSVSFN
ncbi:MAG: AraC family transcriptional regulator, partial [Eudoraea sp.]|uniref:AraC family transcriptional regulator n=1 Tax=Eudoraea sp. TaxID=1979955 RepID=UPI003C7845CB